VSQHRGRLPWPQTSRREARGRDILGGTLSHCPVPLPITFHYGAAPCC
jgi:hypothetical protein